MQIQKLINPPLEMSAPLYGSVLCLGNRNDARRFPKGQRPAPTNRAVVKRRFGRELRAMQCCLFRGPGSTSAGPSRVRHTCGAYMGHSRSWPKWLREREKDRERSFTSSGFAALLAQLREPVSSMLWPTFSVRLPTASFLFWFGTVFSDYCSTEKCRCPMMRPPWLLCQGALLGK